MENRGLLFIPDISGFTRFVNETEIDHSRLIIQELLEVLINSNQIGLQISEIEGDAILFYKFGDSPDLDTLYKQVKEMFCAFHASLIAYDYRRFCQCKACMSAINLSLKIITHYGEFTGYNVKQFSKLIGKDIIVAHQLLKNDIEQHEYWLVTKHLLGDTNKKDWPGWMHWNSSAKQTETGEIAFQYTQLAALKNEIPAQPLVQLDLSKKTKMISLSKVYDTNIVNLFHATGDFNYRSRWLEEVQRVEEINHFLPRVGMRCRCVLANGQSIIYASSYSYSSDKIEFSETDEEDKTTAYYILEKTASHTSQLTFHYYIPKGIVNEVLFNLRRKKKLENKWKQSLENLTSLVKEINFPDLE